MSNLFSLSNLKKHFTMVNIIVGLISLTIGVLFKFSPLPALFLDFFWLDSSELNKYILAGFSGLTIKLGIKGVVEDIVESFLVKPLKSSMNIADILNPNTPSGNHPGQPSGNQYPEAGNSQVGSQQGNSQGGSPQENNRNDRSPNPGPDDIRGFSVDSSGRIRVYDPTNVAQRGLFVLFSNPREITDGSFQPYATNLSKALEYYNTEVTKVTNLHSFLGNSDAFSNNDKKFVKDAAEYMGKTKDLDRNSKPLRKFLKRLP